MDGVTIPAPPPELASATPPGHSRRTRLVLLAVAGAWALLLATTGIWYSLHGRPTAREQTTVAGAQPTVDRALEDVVRAAGTSVVPAVFGYDKVGDCAVTAVRGGVRYQRTLWLYVPVNEELALLDRITTGLPGRYQAHLDRDLRTMTADAGDFIAVDASVPVSGLVKVTATTGCRTLGHPPPTDPTTAPGSDPLGVTGAWHVHALPCGLRTAAVAGPAQRPLRTLTPDGALVATPEVYADRTGLAAHREPGRVTLTRTTGACA
jgi:hypothetical protein